MEATSQATLPGLAALRERTERAAAERYEQQGKGKYRVGAPAHMTPQRWTGLRVFLGPRVSGKKQEAEGFSLEQQQAAMRALVTERGGTIVEPPARWLDLTLGKEVEVPAADVGTAKHDKKRPRYRWAWANRDKWDIYIATAWDRVHRATEMEAFLQTLRDEKKFFYSLREPEFDTTGSTGVIVMSMLIAMARSESLRMQERVQPVKRALVREGMFAVGWKAPFGLRWSEPGPQVAKHRGKHGGGVLVHDDTVDQRNGMTEADIVRLIFESRAAGADVHELVRARLGWCGCKQRNPPVDPNLSEQLYGSIAPNRLDKGQRKKGLMPTKRGRRVASPSGWRKCPGQTRVHNILQNPIYMGLLRYEGKLRDLREPRELSRRGTVYRWAFEPLVSEELWAKANHANLRFHPESVIPCQGQWVPVAMAEWLKAEAERRHGNLASVVRAIVDEHAATAPWCTMTEREAKVRIRYALHPSQVAALQARAKAMGRQRWAAVLRGCIASAMAKEGAGAATSAAVEPASGVRA